MKARVHYFARYDLPDEIEEGVEIAVTTFSTVRPVPVPIDVLFIE